MGIRGVVELIDKDELIYKKNLGSDTNNGLTKKQWLEEFNVELGSLREILNETMSLNSFQQF